MSRYSVALDGCGILVPFMGKLETDSKKRTRNKKIAQVILTSLLVAVAGALNPTMLVSRVLRELKTDRPKRRSAQNSIYVTRKRLLARGLIEYQNGLLRLTERGRDELQLIETRNYQIEKPKRWDKKWRMLIFDIREERKGLRDKVRQTLVSIGFKRLQDSVWVYPYDCEDLVALLKADFHIGKDLLYIIADAIENDVWLKKEFTLE